MKRIGTPSVSSEPEAETASFQGGWNWDGSFNPKGSLEDAPSVCVRYLMTLRRREGYSPAVFAAKLREPSRAKFLGMFSPAVLDQWAALDRWEDWPLAHVGTSAEATIKFQGHGSPELSNMTWQGGRLVPWSDAMRGTAEEADRFREELAKEAALGNEFAAMYLRIFPSADTPITPAAQSNRRGIAKTNYNEGHPVWQKPKGGEGGIVPE